MLSDADFADFRFRRVSGMYTPFNPIVAPKFRRSTDFNRFLIFVHPRKKGHRLSEGVSLTSGCPEGQDITFSSRKMIDTEGNVIYLGQIDAIPGSAAIDPNQWLALIDSHRALEHVPSRMGVNPFTGEPHEYKAPPSTACIRREETKVGSIYWAMDGSPYLTVYAEDDSAEAVATIASEVARALGARFVQENVEE